MSMPRWPMGLETHAMGSPPIASQTVVQSPGRRDRSCPSSALKHFANARRGAQLIRLEDIDVHSARAARDGDRLVLKRFPRHLLCDLDGTVLRSMCQVGQRPVLSIRELGTSLRIIGSPGL